MCVCVLVVRLCKQAPAVTRRETREHREKPQRRTNYTNTHRFHESLGKTECATKADTEVAPSFLSASPHS